MWTYARCERPRQKQPTTTTTNNTTTTQPTTTTTNNQQHNNHTTNNQQQQQPTTNNQQPTTNNQQPTTNNNTIWGGSVSTGEEPPPHSGELKHAQHPSRRQQPTIPAINALCRQDTDISMEHRLRRKQLQL